MCIVQVPASFEMTMSNAVTLIQFMNVGCIVYAPLVLRFNKSLFSFRIIKAQFGLHFWSYDRCVNWGRYGYLNVFRGTTCQRVPGRDPKTVHWQDNCISAFYGFSSVTIIFHLHQKPPYRYGISAQEGDVSGHTAMTAVISIRAILMTS